MPEYDWSCKVCKHDFIVESRISERDIPQTCPKCGKEAERSLIPKVAPHFHLKGGSWYRNGYGGLGGFGKNDKSRQKKS